jgi:hypothetical protein
MLSVWAVEQSISGPNMLLMSASSPLAVRAMFSEVYDAEIKSF